MRGPHHESVHTQRGVEGAPPHFPIRPPRHHHAHPFGFSHHVPNGKSWSCTAWQDVLSVCVAAWPPAGGLEEWRARAWPFACARAAGRRACGGQRTRGRRTRTHSCSLQVGLCKMRKKKDETLDGIFHTGTSTLSAFLLNIDRIDFIPEFTSYCEFGELL